MSSSVRTVSLNEVVVGSRPTHIVIYQESADPLVNVPPQVPQIGQVEPLQKEIKELRDRVAQLEKFIESLDASPSPKPSPFFHAQISGPVGLEVRRLEEAPPAPVPVATVFETLVKSVRATPALVPEPVPEHVDLHPLDEKEYEEKQQVDQEEVEHEVEEEEDGEEEEVEEEEGEAMELTEFEYKGATYYRDAENQVYQKDDEGDLDDDPIGVWNESKQKVLKYPKK